METKIADYFSEKEVFSLTKAASESENSGNLTNSSLTILNDKQLLDLFVPQKYGGLQKDLPSALPWLEATSWIDGSLGWTLTLAAGAGLFGAFLDPNFAQSIFNQKDTFIAGSGFPGGKAEIKNSGLQVSGKWKYASGIKHATIITATCYLSDNGETLFENNEPITKAVALYPDEVDIIGSWNSMGLKATGSHDFKVRNVQIPKERAFSISPNNVHLDGILYQFPFEDFAHCTLAMSLLGIARRFFDEAKELILTKNKADRLNELPKPLQKKFKDNYLNFKKAKERLYKTADHSWQNFKTSKNTGNNSFRSIATQSRQSCEIALHGVQEIYPLLGMSVINFDSIINRCWRDLHTASQHMFLRPQL
jgi:hypothetical protein